MLIDTRMLLKWFLFNSHNTSAKEVLSLPQSSLLKTVDYKARFGSGQQCLDPTPKQYTTLLKYF